MLRTRTSRANPISGGSVAEWQVITTDATGAKTGVTVAPFKTASVKTPQTIFQQNQKANYNPTPPASYYDAYTVISGSTGPAGSGKATPFESVITVTIPPSGKIELASIKKTMTNAGGGLVACTTYIEVYSLTLKSAGGD